MKKKFRALVFRFMAYFFDEYLGRLCKRTNCYEVGFSGCGKTPFDEVMIEKYKFEPLNRVEKWFMKDYIEICKKVHSEAFRNACIDVLGEDPETDWI